MSLNLSVSQGSVELNLTVTHEENSIAITPTIATPVKGDKGDVGEQGIQGIQGEQGIQGLKGDKGDDYTSTQIPNIVLNVNNWTLVSGFWEYNYANALILATSLVNIVPYKDTMDYVKFADIMPMVVSATGTVKIYAINKPLGNINVLIEVI